MYSRSNLEKLFKAVYASRISSHESEAFETIWSRIGPTGLTWILLSGVKLRSVWASLADHGQITRGAVRSADRVTPTFNMVGLYADCGPEDGDADSPYVGSSFAKTWKELKKLSIMARGQAWRVHGEHNNAEYRADNPANHYKIGYPVSVRSAASG